MLAFLFSIVISCLAFFSNKEAIVISSWNKLQQLLSKKKMTLFHSKDSLSYFLCVLLILECKIANMHLKGNAVILINMQ